MPSNQTFATLRSLSSKLDFFLESAPSLLDVFVFNSYTLSMSMSVENRGLDSAVVLVTSAVPANLWSLQLLEQRKDSPTNDFEVKLLDAFARRFGLRVDRLSSTAVSNLNVVYRLRLRPS